MNIKDAIRTAIGRSNKSRREVSKGMGKNPNYISMSLTRGSVPSAEALAGIARECGGSLVIKGIGDDIEIDPPETR